MRPLTLSNARSLCLPGRHVNAVGRHDISMRKPGAELYWFDEHISQPEAIQAGLRNVRAQGDPGEWNGRGNVEVCPAIQLDGSGESDHIRQCFDLKALYRNLPAVAIVDLVSPISDNSVGDVDAGFRLCAGIETNATGNLVAQILRLRENHLRCRDQQDTGNPALGSSHCI